MKSHRLMLSLCVVLIAGMAVTATAQPTLTVDPTEAGPIQAGDSRTFTVSYHPGDDPDPELLLYGFRVVIANGDEDYVTFDTSAQENVDIALGEWPDVEPGLLLAPRGDNELEVSSLIFAGDPVPGNEALSLFTVTLHGDNDDTAVPGDAAIGELNILEFEIYELNGTDFVPIGVVPVTNPVATLIVDDTGPIPAPEMLPEPAFTAGTENTVAWTAAADPSTPAGEIQYMVVREDGPDSGWLTFGPGDPLEYTFGGLVDGQTYTYQVKAKDNVGTGNETTLSDPVFSTQDATLPTSVVGTLAEYNSGTLPLTVTVPYTSDDEDPTDGVASGVQYVELFYRMMGDTDWIPYGTTWPPTGEIEFVVSVAMGDGEYEFLTLATDNAGNVEVDAGGPYESTIVDTQPPVLADPAIIAEPLFTPGTSNVVAWNEAADLADPIEYLVQATGGGDVFASSWQEATSFEFMGLIDGVTYDFQVKARDIFGNDSGFSSLGAPGSFSTQDASPPVTSVARDGAAVGEGTLADPYETAADLIILAFDGSDATSAVDFYRLFYKHNAGSWMQFGDGFVGPLVDFDYPNGDGTYQFYSIGVDIVGNVELAPLDPDYVVLRDTQGPQGTFSVVSAEPDQTYPGYTRTPLVDLLINVSDENGPITFSYQVDSEPIVDYGVVDSGADVLIEDVPLVDLDSEQTIYAMFEDGTGQMSMLEASIILDRGAPLPILGGGNFQVASFHELIAVDWAFAETPDDFGIYGVEIWATLWDLVPNEIGESAYPEYDDVANPDWGGTDAEILMADADWFKVADVPAGELTYDYTEESPWARGAYLIRVFVRDNAGNYSESSAAKRYVNYVLGDFTADGLVDIPMDVLPFSLAYGTMEGDERYDNIFDINTPGNWTTVPETDNMIGFSDLLEVASSFLAQAKVEFGEIGEPMLAWYPIDETTWGFGFSEPCEGLAGIHLTGALPEGVSVAVSSSVALEHAGQHLLLDNPRRGLDVGLAMLEGSGRIGAGELFRVTTSDPVDLSQILVEVFSHEKESVEFELSSEPLVVLPAAYAVGNNYPNPFNPQTTIEFALPEVQDVRLEIFDIRGYRVRSLVNETMPAGYHSVVWNGRDGAGRAVASGTYFYRVQAGPMNETRRMLLVK